jgi:hypothetical protein
VHLDLDVLDKSIGKVNEYESPEGLLEDDLVKCMDLVPQKAIPTSLTVCSSDPNLGDGDKIAAMGVKAIVVFVKSLLKLGLWSHTPEGLSGIRRLIDRAKTTGMIDASLQLLWNLLCAPYFNYTSSIKAEGSHYLLHQSSRYMHVTSAEFSLLAEKKGFRIQCPLFPRRHSLAPHDTIHIARSDHPPLTPQLPHDHRHTGSR